MRATRDLLPVLLGTVVVLALPSLLATDVATAVSAALVTLALAVLVRVASVGALVAAHASVRARGATAGERPSGPGPATDPVHHPLRPRAPGCC